MELQQLMEHFFTLYGPRNGVFLNSLERRIGFLSLAIVDLRRAIRKQVGISKTGLALARIVSRTFCIAEHFHGGLPLVEALSRKYPEGRCSYCGQSPCICGSRRADFQLEQSVSTEQSQWSLTQWCQHLDKLYGANNSAQNVDNLVSHLFEEVGEVLSLAMKIPNLDMPPQKIEFEIALELADVLAWTIAIANVFEVDLESVLRSRYSPGCWKCVQNPCICGPFSFDQVDWLNLSV